MTFFSLDHCNKSKGFTLMELLVVIALLSVFLGLITSLGMNFYRQQVVNEETTKLENNLKNAQSYAISGKGNSSWGIRFFEDYYIFFKGDYYYQEGRDEDEDMLFYLPYGVETGGILEIVFDKNTGRTHIVEG